MKSLFFTFLAFVLWAEVGSAQSFTQVAVQLAETPNPSCTGKVVHVSEASGQCGDAADFNWLTTGSGWSSGLTVVNGASKPATYHFSFLTQGGMASPLVSIYMSAFGGVPFPTTGVVMNLAPGQHLDLNALYPASCNTAASCTPMPDQPQGGSVWVFIEAADAATLEAQQVSQLTFIYSPPGNPPTWQVAVPMVREADAGPLWGSTFTETPVSAKVNNPSSNNTSFAVENISGQSQSVLVTVSDSSNDPIVSAQTPVLAPNATYGVVLADLFGSTMFPDCVNNAAGQCVHLLGSDGLLHGNISFKGMGGGPIIPLVLRAIGNSISSMQVAVTTN